MIKIATIIKGVMIGILFLGFMGMALAGPEGGTEKKVVVKELQGEVGGISSNFIAIVYGQDKKTSYEMALSVDKEVKIEGRKSLGDIGIGDIVSVSFEETTETKKEGDKDISTVVGRLVKKIRFIRPGAKELNIELRSLEEPEQSEEVEEHEETLEDLKE